MFNKQHYEVIAQIIKKELWADAYDDFYDGRGKRSHCQGEAIANVIQARNVIQALADYFAEDNPRFDRGKFYEACNLKD